MGIDILKNELINEFSAFCINLGFSELQIEDSHLGYIRVFGIRDHALSLYIEWREPYLDIEVVRMQAGKIPSRLSEEQDPRMSRMPIRHIYGFELPNTLKCENRDEQLRQMLRCLITTVENNPEVLTEYIQNIESNTSPEKTREYRLACYQRRIDSLDEDYKNGKIELKPYQLLRRKAIQRRDHYLEKKF